MCVCRGGGGWSLIGCLFTVSVWCVYNNTTKPLWGRLSYSSDVLFLYWYWPRISCKILPIGTDLTIGQGTAKVVPTYLSLFLDFFFVFDLDSSRRGNSSKIRLTDRKQYQMLLYTSKGLCGRCFICLSPPPLLWTPYSFPHYPLYTCILYVPQAYLTPFSYRCYTTPNPPYHTTNYIILLLGYLLYERSPGNTISHTHWGGGIGGTK